MDRNNMRSNYVNSGPRSLPHMGGTKRHNSNGHSSSRLSPPAQSSNNNYSSHSSNSSSHGSNSSNHGNNSSSYGNNSSNHGNNGSNYNNNNINQHDDIVNYIFDSWNKVTRELERGSEDAKYYQEVLAPRQLANFRPFNLEDWWGCRMMQTIRKQRS